MPKTKKQKAEYVRTELVVAGTGRFPFDMLRYDTCVPASSDDMSVIYNDDRVVTSRQVKLCRFSPEGTKATDARWRSFGWVVLSDTGVNS